jgi:molybdopterin-guanine dinucleotide biosynthesis protein B
VLVEGFKSGHFPKLEVWREAVGKPPLWREAQYAGQIVAVASDTALPADAPAPLRLDDLEGVARCVRAHATAISAAG